MPIILIVSWVNGIPMDLDLNLLETGSLVMTVFTTAFTLQVLKQITKKSRTHWYYLKCVSFFCGKQAGCMMMLIYMQDDKWHYLKGFNLTLCYIVIAACFFTIKALPSKPIEQLELCCVYLQMVPWHKWLLTFPNKIWWFTEPQLYAKRYHKL